MCRRGVALNRSIEASRLLGGRAAGRVTAEGGAAAREPPGIHGDDAVGDAQPVQLGPWFDLAAPNAAALWLRALRRRPLPPPCGESPLQLPPPCGEGQGGGSRLLPSP